MSQWCDPEYDKIVAKAKVMSDIPGRTSQYIKAQEYFQKKIPWIPLAHATVFRGMSKNVEGYKISPLGMEDFYPIDIK